MRVFGDGIVINLFGPKRNKVTGSWKNLHNAGLHNCTPNHYYTGVLISP